MQVISGSIIVTMLYFIEKIHQLYFLYHSIFNIASLIKFYPVKILKDEKIDGIKEETKDSK